jgi:predicted kinase
MSDALPGEHLPAAVWVVAGPPGSGKSTIAERLLTRLQPTPALLDKDVLFSGFVEEVLLASGRSVGEREGAWYDQHVKVHEYGGMTAAARQIRGAGCPVMLVAPFTTQIRDPGRWTGWVRDLGGEPVRLIWVRTDAMVLRERLAERGRARDGGKLGAFESFVARMMPGTPPPVPHHEVDNTSDLATLNRQVDALAADTRPVR